MDEPFDWRDFFFSFEGRISREDFWCGFLAFILALLTLVLATGYLPKMAADFLCGILYTAAIYPVAALMTKRLRDRGKGTGHLCLFLGFPVAYSVFNLFGPSPDNPLALLLSALYVPVTLWSLIELCFLPGTIGQTGQAGNASRRARIS